MPIPERLRPPSPTAEEVAAFTDLCQQIEDRQHSDEDAADLLSRWNRRAGREYTASEFRSYYGAMGIDEFVAEMLMGQAKLVPDLAYPELRHVLEEVESAAISQPEQSYYLGWLEANLPGSTISNLIYWPNHWFDNESMLHVELTADQILAYAMARSGRRIPGAPENVPMPYPIP